MENEVIKKINLLQKILADLEKAEISKRLDVKHLRNIQNLFSEQIIYITESLIRETQGIRRI